MRLQSVQALKQRLLETVVGPITPRRTAARRPVHDEQPDADPLAVGARALDSVPVVYRSIALGVTGRGPEYQLAVRVQRPALMNSRLVDQIVKDARGEAEVRLIGRVDKRAARRVRAQAAAAVPWHRDRQRPLLIGTSAGHADVTAGTLGAFVRRGTSVCILSNNHVLANEDKGKAGDAILQPGRYDVGRNPADRVASLKWWVRLKPTAANRVDAALAEVTDTIEYDPTRLRALIAGADATLAGLGPDVSDVDAIVRKVGRTTGPTEGRITAFDVDNVVVGYDAGNLRFDGQLEIEGAATRGFSDGGDSGSLIVDADHQAVALLFAGSDTGGTNGLGLTYANAMSVVLKDLKATLLLSS
jgi:hypothetical protein